VKPAEAPSEAVKGRTGVEEAAGALFEAGIRFLESLAPPRQAQPAGRGEESPVQQVLSALFQKDPRTDRPVLAIPLPEAITHKRLAGALAGLLSGFANRG
jgi:hypothetical protein